MRVFVAGASGTIGRRLVPSLVEAGHDVTGMTRSADKADLLRGAGADPTVCDALDAEAVRDAVAAAKPEVVVHELTAIPPAFNPRRMAEEFAPTNRLRTEGTRHLVDAAAAAGARRVVAQSIAFAYAPAHGWAKAEDAQLFFAPRARRRPWWTAGARGGASLLFASSCGPGPVSGPNGPIAEQVVAGASRSAG